MDMHIQQSTASPAVPAAATDNGILQPLSICLDMPMYHTNGNDLKTSSPVFDNADNNDDSNLPSAQVPPQIIYTIPNFNDFVSETPNGPISPVAANPIADIPINSVSTTTKVSTPKVTKSKTKGRAKLRTINYSNQKLILPNKEHIPLQSLLSPGEAVKTNGINGIVRDASATTNNLKRKVAKNRANAKKLSATTVTKKDTGMSTESTAPNTATSLVGNEDFTPCFVYSENVNAEKPVIVPNRRSGVFAITAPTATITNPYCLTDGIYSAHNKVAVNDYDMGGPANGKVTNNGNSEHFVARNFNFAEYAMAEPPIIASNQPCEIVNVNNISKPITSEADNSITLKT